MCMIAYRLTCIMLKSRSKKRTLVYRYSSHFERGVDIRNFFKIKSGHLQFSNTLSIASIPSLDTIKKCGYCVPVHSVKSAQIVILCENMKANGKHLLYKRKLKLKKSNNKQNEKRNPWKRSTWQSPKRTLKWTFSFER